MLTPIDVLVYTEGGKVSHILPWSGSPNKLGQEALCGRSAFPQLWRGTGDQEEHERAREKRLCIKCEEILRAER